MRQDYLRNIKGAAEENSPATPEAAFFEFLDCAMHGQCFNAASEYGLNLDVYMPEPSKRKAVKVDATGRPFQRDTLVRRGSGAEQKPDDSKKRGRPESKGDA